MHKIKIAHVLHSVGGVDVSVRIITENLNSDLFENVIIHGIDDTNKPFIDNKNQKIKDYKLPIYRNISLIKDLKALMYAYQIIKNERPHLIHAHSSKGGVLGRLVGKWLNIKVLYTPQAFSYLSTENTLKKKLYLLIEKTLAFKNSYVLASSNSERVRAINEVGYPEDKVLLFNNSIKPIHEFKSSSIKLPEAYICTVGRPSYQKNIELMIKVFKEVSNEKAISLVIMGVGHHSDRLKTVQNLIQELDLDDKVVLVEWTSRETIFDIVKQSKLYISTARYEGLPYSVIESLALGVPAVVSDADGNRDLIINGINGYVIENENIQEFKNKIIKLLNSEDLHETFSKNSLKQFDEKYNINKTIMNLEGIYSSFK